MKDNRPNKKATNQAKINFAVMAKSIIIIEEDGTKLPAMSNQSAQVLAADRGLDLIEININNATDEAICKIADYAKFLYLKKKKEKLASKQQREKAIDNKEIQLRANTDDGDIEVKAKKAIQFLDNGDRVKVILSMRNRELSHKDVGENTIKKFLSFITSPDDIENPLHNEGNNLVAVLFRKRK
jgi:translation initiation factor IF-3